MIPITSYKDKKVAVFGLGGSGISAALALKLGGARVIAWDDREPGRQLARDNDIPVHDLRNENWDDFEALILSPGVPLTHPEPHWTVGRAKAAGIEVIGDTELFFRQKIALGSKAKVVAITGTNGKSTTTALTAHMLRTAGFNVTMGGNIGKPVLDLEPLADDRVYVIEFSSYQIDLTPSLAPDVAVLLNISPDHLDRHGSLKNYARVKGKIFAKVKKGGLAVVGMDDDITARISTILQDHYETVRISNSLVLDDGISAEGGKLYRLSGGHVGNPLNLAGCAALRGRHNWQNAAAAFAIGRHLGMGQEEILEGFATFPGLAHRMEEVGRLGNILFINDSKATNAESAGHALSAFENIYWIAGGLPKAGGITELAPYFADIRNAYLIGEAAGEFCKTLSKPPQREAASQRQGGAQSQAALASDLDVEMVAPVPCDMSGTLEVAVAAATRDAQSRPDEQTVVLLSPACASFDQFKSFEVRGNRFKEIVAAIPGIQLTGQ